jgi:hypothetical protein
MRRTTALGLVASLAVVCLVPRVFAEGADRQQVEAWIQSMIDRGAVFPPIPGYSIRWRSEVHELPPPGELRRMKREASGHPDHPYWRDIEIYERRARP